MNRIVLIGNGFDLAHGLETSYNHFLKWLKNQKIVKNASDYFEHIKVPPNLHFGKGEISASSFFEKYYKNSNDLDKFISDCSKCRFTHKNKFLEHLMQKVVLQNWVDIEEEYYLALNQHLNKKNETAVEELNNNFSNIQKDLENYLKTQIANDKLTILEQNIYSPLFLEDFQSKPNIDDVENILFLNFNYTNTEKLYIQSKYSNSFDSISTIHIHGELGNADNPVIFGYGDELDDKYKFIEKENKNMYLENIKSIKYLETNNYRKLLTFIDSGEYQIFIMGHSCGISDRTLLNTLFEHENCKSIKIFYHKKEDGSDNYSDIVRNASRNFNDKRQMRKIIIGKTNCVSLLENIVE